MCLDALAHEEVTAVDVFGTLMMFRIRGGVVGCESKVAEYNAGIDRPLVASDVAIISASQEESDSGLLL
eukprot:2146728-Pleurochrysis_carterae.AAC.2